MAGRVIYVCGARGFRSDRPRRKMKDMVKCWRGLGYEVEYFCGGDLYESSNTPADDVKARAQYYQKWYRKVPFMSPFVQSCSERRDIRHTPLMLDRLTSIVKQNRPDIIWERNSRMASASLDVAQKNGIPYVFEWMDHVIPYSISLYHHKAVEIEKRKNQQADYIVVVSEKLREDLAQEGVEKNKILVAYNAVNPEEFRANRAERQRYRSQLGIEDSEVLVGYLGSYAFYHDMIRLVLAADILRKRKEAEIKILMVGVGEQYKKTLRLAKQRNLLGSMIMMKPWVPAEMVPEVLSALDIAVLPGCTDIICPIKVQEYMATELAVVVPDYLCNREVVTDGQTGVLFEPKNEKSLADKLLLLAKDSKTRAALGKQARQEVLRRFTWEKTWGKTLQEIMRRIGHIDNDGQ
jgi:glycosyltransferase involved in cell wall biosynthesis